MLELQGVHVDIASAQVLRGFSMTLQSGQMLGLVGRNGAGKTSTLRSIMGHLPLRQGHIHFNGQSLSALPPEARAGLGIGYMPEDRGLVPELTVEENMLIPLWVSKTLHLQDRLDFVYQVLPELKDMAPRRALLLSGGQQKLVALGRAPCHNQFKSQRAQPLSLQTAATFLLQLSFPGEPLSRVQAWAKAGCARSCSPRRSPAR
jgi:branched-chain amino acid transport system ATP-binding protein